jgi:hypothetical protein
VTGRPNLPVPYLKLARTPRALLRDLDPLRAIRCYAMAVKLNAGIRERIAELQLRDEVPVEGPVAITTWRVDDGCVTCPACAHTMPTPPMVKTILRRSATGLMVLDCPACRTSHMLADRPHDIHTNDDGSSTATMASGRVVTIRIQR